LGTPRPVHSLLTAELESTETFRGTMVIGYYRGTEYDARRQLYQFVFSNFAPTA
jgi:hypothetical protein